MSGKIKSILQGYLRQDNRITLKLTILVQLLKEQKNSLKDLSKQIKSTSKPLKLFRALILIHQCYLNNFLICDQIIGLISLIKNASKPRQNIQLDQIINKKVISQYCLYLQKCVSFKQQLLYGQYENIQPYRLLYMYINLLKYGLGFVDVLYMFGRYYRNQYLFIIDFNITIAKDFLDCYNSIKKILIINRNLWNEQMKQQMQNIHQKMYIVYYNCYFYKQLIGTVPKWIDTQPISPNKNRSRSTANKTTSISPTKSLNSTLLQKSSIFQKSTIKKQFSLLSTIVPIQNKSMIIESGSKTKQSSSGKSKDMNKSLLLISQFNTEINNCNQDNSIIIDQDQDAQSQNQNSGQNNIQNQQCQLIKDMKNIVDLIDSLQCNKQLKVGVTYVN